MVGLRRCIIGCVLVAVSLTASADVVPFPGKNTVNIKGGGVGRIVGATAIKNNPATMDAVIDARDRFGNKVRLRRTLKASANLVRLYGRQCIKSLTSAFACAGATAIAAAAAYEGYEIINGLINNPGLTPGECPTRTTPIEIDGGMTVNTFVGLPCIDSRYSYKVTVITPNPSEDLVTWADTVQGPNERYYSTVAAPDIPILGDTWSYVRAIQNPDAPVSPPLGSHELSPEQYRDLLFDAGPEALQIAPGEYPNVWEEVDLDGEVNPDPGEDTDIDPDPEADPELIDMTEVPEKTIDIEGYFTFGSGWLPRQCPAPEAFDVYDQQFTFKYDTLCTSIVDYVAPMTKFFAIMAFLGIVIGGGLRG